MKYLISLILVLLNVGFCSGYTIALKNGKNATGTLLEKTDQLIRIKSSDGLTLVFKIAQIDQAKTDSLNANQTAPAQTPAAEPSGTRSLEKTVVMQPNPLLKIKKAPAPTPGTKTYTDDDVAAIRKKTNADVEPSDVSVMVVLYTPSDCEPCQRMKFDLHGLRDELKGGFVIREDSFVKNSLVEAAVDLSDGSHSYYQVYFENNDPVMVIGFPEKGSISWERHDGILDKAGLSKVVRAALMRAAVDQSISSQSKVKQ